MMKTNLALKPPKAGVMQQAGVPMNGTSLASFVQSRMPASKKNKMKFKKATGTAGYKAG